MRYRRDELERARRPAGREAGPTGAAGHVLALQRRAGNRAVSALLARAPGTTVPAGEPRTGASGARATLPGIGTIALLSVQLSPRGARGGGRQAETPQTSGEIYLASRLGTHSPGLQKAAIVGRPMDVEIVIPHGGAVLRLSLTGAIVSSYRLSGEEESWTLDFAAIKHTVEQETGTPGDDPGAQRRD